MGSRWTPEQDVWLCGIYPTTCPDDLVALFRAEFGFYRTHQAIQSHAMKVLGLHKDASYAKRCGVLGALRYTDEEVEWVREAYPNGDVYDTLDAFEARFGRRPSKRGLYVLASRLGLKKEKWGAEHGARANTRMRWSQMDEEREWMIANAGHPAKVRDVIEGFKERFGIELCRSQVSLFRAEYGLSKRASHGGGRKRVPVGTERVSKGYVLVKVAEDATVPQSKDNWMPKQQHVWEQANGPLPEGHMVLFADGDRGNFDPDNLVAVERRLIGPMNQAGATWTNREELEACVALARLKVAVNDKEHGMERTCGVCGRRFTEPEERRRYGTRAQTCPECCAMGRKAKGNRSCGTGRCAVCGREFEKYRGGQRRCPACIAEKPSWSAEQQLNLRRRMGA